MKKLFLIISLSLTTLVAISQSQTLWVNSGDFYVGSTKSYTMNTNDVLTINAGFSPGGNFDVYPIDSNGVATGLALSNSLPFTKTMGTASYIIGVLYMDNPNTMIKIFVTLSGTSVGENELSTNVFSVYPNPTTDFINIKGDLTYGNFEVYDITGKSLIKTTNKQINVSYLPVGTYFVRIGKSVREFTKQ